MCSWHLKIHENAFAAGSALDAAGGAYNAHPDPLVGWGGGYPLPIPHLGVPRDGALGASTHCPGTNNYEKFAPVIINIYYGLCFMLVCISVILLLCVFSFLCVYSLFSVCLVAWFGE